MKVKTAAQKLKALKEVAFRASVQSWLRKEGLPPCQFEHRFDPVRKWRFDLVWESRLVAVEVEGNIHHKSRHTTGTGFLGDCDKYNAATAAGWRVFRVARPPQSAKWASVLYSPQTVNWLKAVL